MARERIPDHQADGIFRLIFESGWLIGWSILGFGYGPPPGDPRRRTVISMCLAVGGVLFVAALIGSVYSFRQHARQQKHQPMTDFPDELPQQFEDESRK